MEKKVRKASLKHDFFKSSLNFLDDTILIGDKLLEKVRHGDDEGPAKRQPEYAMTVGQPGHTGDGRVVPRTPGYTCYRPNFAL